MIVSHPIRARLLIPFLKLNEALPVPALAASAQIASKLQQAAQEFNSANGALLFWSAYTAPHSILRAGRVDLVVHLGWTGDPVLRKSYDYVSELYWW